MLRIKGYKPGVSEAAGNLIGNGFNEVYDDQGWGFTEDAMMPFTIAHDGSGSSAGYVY